MKKKFLIPLCSALCLVGITPTFAESTGGDLQSQYSEDAESIELSAGIYVASEDIPAGKYDISVLSGYGSIKIWASLEDYDADKYRKEKYYVASEDSDAMKNWPDSYSSSLSNIRLSDGFCLVVDSGLKLLLSPKDSPLNASAPSSSESSGTTLSSSEDGGELTHYEDEYVEFDYYDNDGIFIEKYAGAGFARYTFSDIQELSISGTTVNVVFEINSESIVSMDDYIKRLSTNDNFQLFEGESSMYSYTHNSQNYISSLDELRDDYYLVTTYSTDSESFVVSNYFDDALSSFVVKDTFDSMPEGFPTRSTICAWFFTPDDWIIEDVGTALDICKQYRILKLTHDEAAEKISELHDLLISTNASATMSVVNSYFQYDKGDLDTAISALETFIDRQFVAEEAE